MLTTRKRAVAWGVAAALGLLPLSAQTRRVEVREAAALQNTIDELSREGGGTAALPAGATTAAEVQLRDNVTLELARGAVLEANVLIAGARNTSIVGAGQETSFVRGLVNVRRSHGVTLRGYTQDFRNGTGVHDTDGITMRNVTIRQARQKQAEGSAIWFVNCRNIDVADCDFSSNDDVFCLKRSAENVSLKNTVLTGHLAAPWKIGTESDGVFRNISMTDCTIRDSDRAAITIESVDGAVIDGVAISRVKMLGVAAPLYIRLGDRLRHGRPVGAVRNITITDIESTPGAWDDAIGSSILGLPDHPVENVRLTRVRWTYRGGGTHQDARRLLPDFSSHYPEYDIHGRLPAYGLYARHVRGLALQEVDLAWRETDLRPPVVFDHVEGLARTGGEWRTPPAATVTIEPGARACASLQEAAAQVKPGETIVLSPGRLTLDAARLPVRLGKPGVTVRSARGAAHTAIEARGTDADRPNSPLHGRSIFFVTADRVAIEGLTLGGAAYNVEVENAAGVQLERNHFDGASRDHILAASAPGLRVADNTARGASGRLLQAQNLAGAVVEGNRIYEQSGGIRLQGAKGAAIRGNRCEALSWDCVYLTGVDGSAIENNHMLDGRLTGLQLRASNGNRVTGNVIRGNKTEGVLVDLGSKENVFRQNEIAGNRRTGLANETPHTIDAAENWWGAESGPSGAGPGAGDKVDANVNFTPWLKPPRR